MTDPSMTDDLLDELEQLEASSEALDEQVNQNQKKQEAFQKLDSASTIDAVSLALETAKTAQEAANQSQKAAETALEHAQRQKEQIMELSDANFGWRQNVKSANKELQSSKKSVSIMLGLTVVLSLVSMSVMGWLLYNVQQKELHLKGEILDVLQTENTLHQKQITLKVDELASFMEMLAADLKNRPAAMPGTTDSETAQTTSAADTAAKTMDEAALVNLASEADTGNKPGEEQNASSQEGSEPDVASNSETVHQTMVADAASRPDVMSEAQYAELKSLLEQLLREQQNVQIQAPPSKSPVMDTKEAAELKKQLTDIGWLVRKQSGTLEKIKQQLSQASGTGSKESATQLEKSLKKAEQNYEAIQKTLNELKAQLGTLKSQQNMLQEQVNNLQQETEKLSAKPKPYSYRIPQ
ncbi:hypothetical protein QCB44_06240 [Thiomicrorhabdus sp. zzn3]|uniref:hypothetical protein n=1 Tax=Thiomicrorhabdus sp. zzn3 TaxID=3039775 RepID=UPI0024370B03|nr:hypothetical protein [Thiomicrorhabdus sp. zzn3]MDG6778298.1 hypothetical protein [Thiomicrorhabdus sp. zzn3]